MSSITVNNKRVPFNDGEKLLNVLRNAGYSVSAPCGGNGKCGKCAVSVDGEMRAACKTEAVDGMTVELQDVGAGNIETASEQSFAFTPRKGKGAAVDLGTTTVAVKLFDLETGHETETRSAWNAQKAFGADVITRAQYTMENPDGLEKLSAIIRAQIKELCPDADEVFVAGNTVMEHIAAGISPAGIVVAPFTPLTLFSDGGSDKELKFSPCAASYVGGDITAGLLSAKLHEREGNYLFLDIGTNGEMAIGGKNGFTCCAVACGPAFEGTGISCGMQSTEGAVNHVRLENGKFVYDVIGGGEIKGICGSGLIDLLAVLLETEIVDETGRLLPPDEVPEEYESLVSEDENGNGIFHLSDKVSFTAADVRQLQLAKAAVAAGIKVLVKYTGTALAELDGLCLAGGFGSYLSVHNAARIGMLPTELTGKTEVLGNTSLKGACEVLLMPERFEKLREICKSCRYIELSGNRDFSDEFMEQMLFEI